ncbi:hypothetical protein MKX47_02860 [Solibacillus sp. FSL R7-0668]|uniref:hypothetical protein n=1 Tax=Solibacillus sp. FSL R7-0668 TaxID=2921688 RepID=UPI0030FA28A7
MAKKNKFVATVFSAALVTSAIAAPALAADVTSKTAAPTAIVVTTTTDNTATTTQPTATTTQAAASVTAKDANAVLTSGSSATLNPDGTIAFTENGTTTSITKESFIERILNALFK